MYRIEVYAGDFYSLYQNGLEAAIACLLRHAGQYRFVRLYAPDGSHIASGRFDKHFPED